MKDELLKRVYERLGIPTSIAEINGKYNYKDEHPNGKHDSELVACGQRGSYNELEYIYRTYLAEQVARGTFSELSAITALRECCEELHNPRSRKDFYQLLSGKLGIKIE